MPIQTVIYDEILFSFLVPFCRIDRLYQHNPDLRTDTIQFLISCIINIICFQQKFQPVTRFVGFFEGDLQFGDEIRFAVGVLCFVYVCSDTGSGSADLIGNNRFVLAFQEFHQIENLNRKVNRKCTQFAFSHKMISFCKVIYHRKRKKSRRLAAV